MTATDSAFDLPDIVKRRRAHSETRLDKVRKHITGIPHLVAVDQLCIYATGSYARGEGSQYSDLDLFFVYTGDPDSNAISKITKTMIDSSLIQMSRDMGFPEFSADGRYLEIHSVERMKDALGSPADDYNNFFTARLLLLLESTPLWNRGVYDTVVADIVGTYYRDYHDHVTDFRPIFLANDILRFWKTLCLNYENRRNSDPDDVRKRNEHHLSNLKLKFSRLLTCLSTVMLLSRARAVVRPEDLLEFAHHTPVDRLVRAGQGIPGAATSIHDALAQYAWFLDLTAMPRDALRDWIGDATNRRLAFDHAREFGISIYGALSTIASADILRYIVI